MNDSPGWASPGSPPPSDDRGAGSPRPAGEQDGPAPNWSGNQPPPGQWSPSAPGPGDRVPPGPGWGGGPYGGWARPPAPKPGVIPLRPLGAGEILDGAVATLRTHWRTVLGITLTVSVVVQLAEVLLHRYVLPRQPAIDPDASPSEALEQVGESLRASMIATVPSSLLAMTAMFVTTALLTFVVSRSVLGRPVTLEEVWRDARPRLVPLLGLTLLLPLMVTGIVLAGVVPGWVVGSEAGVVLMVVGVLAALLVVCWLTVRFSLSYSVVMLERQGVVASLRRSARLVRGSWWRVFGILILTVLLTFLVMMIVVIPFTLLAFAVGGEGMGGLLAGEAPRYDWTFLIVTGIGAVIGSAIVYPISAGVPVLLYVDLRIRREALDLELARAAGVPGYGSASPGDPGPRG
ncbi:hypothetical protein LUX12_13950 [Streptomyces somaliensis]|uniref:DUF7544 domain-containing protein n=1 Tax=Streptomyces somaliensis TaxID=78355 RepID=UPI0020CB8610|nr:hypothetical protein [Streptomyces somaliensis]MCP9961173.1 hypothetical protein [Streptomyces somaliensis]MCP9973967.1 hypothetical protein [Streptomyces somaliensis]